MPITDDAGSTAAEQADATFDPQAEGMRIRPEPNAQVNSLLRSMLNEWVSRQTAAESISE